MSAGRTHARIVIVLGIAAIGLVVAAAPAVAIGSVSMTTSPSSTVSWGLTSTGANSTSGGTMTLNATAAYIVTVVADKNTMSEWDGAAYVTGGKTLGSALTVTAARTGGTSVIPGVGLAAVVSTSSATLATGTGPGTDDFSVTLSQPTLITDAALATGRTYHIVLTYTASLAV